MSIMFINIQLYKYNFVHFIENYVKTIYVTISKDNTPKKFMEHGHRIWILVAVRV